VSHVYHKFWNCYILLLLFILDNWITTNPLTVYETGISIWCNSLTLSFWHIWPKYKRCPTSLFAEQTKTGLNLMATIFISRKTTNIYASEKTCKYFWYKDVPFYWTTTSHEFVIRMNDNLPPFPSPFFSFLSWTILLSWRALLGIRPALIFLSYSRLACHLKRS